MEDTILTLNRLEASNFQSRTNTFNTTINGVINNGCQATNQCQGALQYAARHAKYPLKSHEGVDNDEWELMTPIALFHCIVSVTTAHCHANMAERRYSLGKTDKAETHVCHQENFIQYLHFIQKNPIFLSASLSCCWWMECSTFPRFPHQYNRRLNFLISQVWQSRVSLQGQMQFLLPRRIYKVIFVFKGRDLEQQNAEYDRTVNVQ